MKNKKRTILNLIPLALLIGLSIWVLAIYSDLPQTIPIHYNMAGEPNGWGSKTNIFILLGVLGVLDLFMVGFTLIPRKYAIDFINGAEGCTQEGKELIYDASMDILRIINIFVNLALGYVLVAPLCGYPMNYVWLPVVGIVSVFVWGAVKCNKIKKMHQTDAKG